MFEVPALAQVDEAVLAAHACGGRSTALVSSCGLPLHPHPRCLTEGAWPQCCRCMWRFVFICVAQWLHCSAALRTS